MDNSSQNKRSRPETMPETLERWLSPRTSVPKKIFLATSLTVGTIVMATYVVVPLGDRLLANLLLKKDARQETMLAKERRANLSEKGRRAYDRNGKVERVTVKDCPACGCQWVEGAAGGRSILERRI